MDIIGQPQSGQWIDRLSFVAGTVVVVRGATRQIGSLPDGTPIMGDIPDGPVQFADTLTYDVLVELPTGSTIFEKCKPVSPQWQRPLKVRIPAIGDFVYGWAIGDQFHLWLQPMPDNGPCDTAPPPALSAPVAPPPPAPRDAPGEKPYDPSTDPLIVSNAKGSTSGPETDSLGSTSGDA